MAPRQKKEVQPVPLQIPDKVEGIDQWLVMGLDPSTSRTGYCFMLVSCDTAQDKSKARWIEVGSFKPAKEITKGSSTVWLRSKLVALAVRSRLGNVIMQEKFDLSRTGLIISFEAPTPQNDFLTSISRILHLILFETESPASMFPRIHVQMTNASTLRSLMGLTQKGATNKKENVVRAYSFLDQGSYPNLDTDACDAILMAMMARYTSAILLGHPGDVPKTFLTRMCDASVKTVGKGRNAHTRVEGLLHRPEYFTQYQRQSYSVQLCDARTKKARLDRLDFTI